MHDASHCNSTHEDVNLLLPIFLEIIFIFNKKNVKKNYFNI